LASKLDQLRAMTTVVADTGDLSAVARLKPVDCTTNPTIVLKAIDTPEYRDVVDEALAWGRRQSGDAARVAAATADRLAVSVGVELLRLVPGYVSTEVDANLSFNVAASVARAARSPTPTSSEASGPNACSSNSHRRGREYALHRGVKCNMTLLLNRAQAIASAEAGAFVISPFVGRIYDWHKKSGGKDFTADEDPGVRSVPDIYGYYKSNGIGHARGASRMRSGSCGQAAPTEGESGVPSGAPSEAGTRARRRRERSPAALRARPARARSSLPHPRRTRSG
jgi:transaldolase